MRKYYFLLITLFVGSFCFSQTNSTNKKLLPVSIYTSSLNATNSYNSNSFTSIAKKLNFNKYYKFITVSFDDIDNGRFLISDDNLTTKPTIFIYDDYKKCALDGYQRSINMINTIDEKIFKDKKYIIKFNCMELKDNI